MASTANVSAVEASYSSPAAAARDTTTAPGHLDAPVPSAPSPTAAGTSRLEPTNTESGAKEKNDTEDVENKSSPSDGAAATTLEDATTTANSTTTNLATELPANVQASNVPGSANVTEGEASDQAVKEAEEPGPELVITLLLTTGARHPFKIDRKYLRKRSVEVDNDDPFNMSVYTLKELIWKEWRAEWEPQPSSPSAIRLISFGKLLDDKSPLSESSLTHDAPNVIHMTVKPQEVVDEEDAKGGKSYSTRDRDATDRSPSCRCIIL